MRGRWKHGILALAAIVGSLLAAPANCATVTFLPGLYFLSDVPGGIPTDALFVAVGGGTVSFDLLDFISGDTTEFSFDAAANPVAVYPDSIYYDATTPGLTAEYDTTAYPYITFYTEAGNGGLTIGSIPGANGDNLFDLYTSLSGPGQVYAIPEPETWALMLTGFATLGATLRQRRRVRVAFAAPRQSRPKAGFS